MRGAGAPRKGGRSSRGWHLEASGTRRCGAGADRPGGISGRRSPGSNGVGAGTPGKCGALLCGRAPRKEPGVRCGKDGHSDAQLAPAQRSPAPGQGLNASRRPPWPARIRAARRSAAPNRHSCICLYSCSPPRAWPPESRPCQTSGGRGLSQEREPYCESLTVRDLGCALLLRITLKRSSPPWSVGKPAPCRKSWGPPLHTLLTRTLPKRHGEKRHREGKGLAKATPLRGSGARNERRQADSRAHTRPAAVPGPCRSRERRREGLLGKPSHLPSCRGPCLPSVPGLRL